MPDKKTFFISREKADRHWAELIASVVRDAGHEAIHEEDSSPGASFMHSMRAASANSDCTIAVLSPAYFESEYCLAELNAALALDPNGVKGQILPVLVARCGLPPDLVHLVNVNLVGMKEDNARELLLTVLQKHGPVIAPKLDLIGRLGVKSNMPAATGPR